MTAIKNWILTPQNIVGIIIIAVFSGLMVKFGHDYMGMIKITENLSAPIAALPVLFGFFILKTDLTSNIEAIRTGQPPKDPSAGG